VGYDEKKAEAKRQELRGLIAQTFEHVSSDEAARLATEVAKHFADVTPPYWEPPPVQMVRLSEGGRGRATTTKPGNVVLNLRKLVVAIASGTLTIAGAMAVPWTLVVGALVTWDSLYSSLQLEISEIQGCVLWSLWKERDDGLTVAKAEVFDAVSRERTAFGMQPLTPQEVEYALADLARMRCIKQSVNDRERWWLREWVTIRYR